MSPGENTREFYREQGRTQERERIINDLKDQFAFAVDCETQDCLEQFASSVVWSERWQLTFNQLIELIKEQQK
jgi:hypothetical protein